MRYLSRLRSGGLLSTTAPLRAELERSFGERPFTVRFWDGTTVESTTSGPTFLVHSPRAIAHMLRAPGELGLARAYVQGLLDVDDIDGAIEVVESWRPPGLAARRWLGLAAGAVRAMGLTLPPARPKIELRLRGQRHSIRRDREAIRYHYDAGNEFFALFLDPSMTYSCAIFSRGARTLEQAQETKLELVCAKLGLEEGTRVLDVGCGWGSFALHAATRHGARVLGITLSEPQVHFAQEHARELGVEDRVEFRVADYRELTGDSFDAIASIGMVEHVGEANIDVYAADLGRLLRPGGRLLNHGIAQLRHGDDNDAGPVSERYVFPDGEPLHLSRVVLALERAGFTVEHVEGFAEDYARTVSHWLERYEGRFDDAVALAGIERARIWRVYLHAARNGFQSGFESVYQVKCRLPERDARGS
ncbi:MAG: cyclopropane-fatty-acyl-phospholipid synthase family protein [Solirubrobacterales bacterium]